MVRVVPSPPGSKERALYSSLGPLLFMHVTAGFANTVFISILPSNNCWALWKATVLWADCTRGIARGQAAASLPSYRRSPLRAHFGPLRRIGSVPA